MLPPRKVLTATVIIFVVVMICSIMSRWQLLAVRRTSELNSKLKYKDDSPHVGGADNQKATENGKTKVLLVTHYRGGSTFLGDLFSQDDDSFYWFEPLHAFLRSFNQLGKKGDSTIIENTYYKLTNDVLKPLPASITSIRLKTLTEAMNCDIQRMNTSVLKEGVLTSAFHAPSASEYSRCYRETSRDEAGVAQCMPILQASCDSRSLVVAKTVRTPMYLADDLLGAIPDLKIIYSTRDPRGVMNSRRKQQKYDDDAIVQNGHNLCLRMLADYTTYNALLPLYPERILHITYEKLALDPTGWTERMYAFLGLDVPTSIRQWISENTKATKQTRGNSTKKNSTEVATKWKTELSRSVINRLTETCKETLVTFGYPL